MSEPVYITRWQDLEGETIERVVHGDSVYMTLTSGKRVVIDSDWEFVLLNHEPVAGQLLHAKWITKEEYPVLLKKEQDKSKADRRAIRRVKYEALKEEFCDEHKRR